MVRLIRKVVILIPYLYTWAHSAADSDSFEVVGCVFYSYWFCFFDCLEEEFEIVSEFVDSEAELPKY